MKLIKKPALLFLTLTLLSFPSIGQTSAYVGTSLFQRGNKSLSITGGSGRAFSQDYFVLGLGFGYYLVNGLALGLRGEAWMGNDPKIYTLSPEVQYVFYQVPRIHPYVGAFYKRTFYESLDDLDSYGGRVGAFVPTGNNVVIGVGYVFEKLSECTETKYRSCSNDYPEFTIGVGF